ncbi:hypothetical protein EVAR_65749_1 [Eumeta japonica]|uniref:Uncharacterized protein n=1 Tax=Eumeta variegata TaxID=151549 RepID=A0A4C1ZPJ8_EUMVA|nr:hypothetical protein EVAR_65749_1 [Eumeta japonica]
MLTPGFRWEIYHIRKKYGLHNPSDDVWEFIRCVYVRLGYRRRPLEPAVSRKVKNPNQKSRFIAADLPKIRKEIQMYLTQSLLGRCWNIRDIWR